MTQIPIIVLAAGQSKRMRGCDKLLQKVDGIPLLRRTALTALAAGPVIVALPSPPSGRNHALEGLDLTQVAVPDADQGMNISLTRALRAVPENAPAAMVLLADLPDITTTDLQAVLRAAKQNPSHLIWRGTTELGKPGHPVIFHQSLFEELASLSGDSGAKDVIQTHADRVFLQALPGNNALLDLDTPEDWADWRAQRKP